MPTTPMIATILDLERRAEAILEKARENAATIQRDAHSRRSEELMSRERQTTETMRDMERSELEKRERQASDLREQLGKELESVRNISPNRQQAGINLVLTALLGEGHE